MEKNGNIVMFYRNNKDLIEITGFLGVIAALFLYLPNKSESLRMVQAFLLMIFSCFVTYIIYKIINENKENTPYGIVINRMIISVVLMIFVFNVFRFTYQEYKIELFRYCKSTIIGIIILLSLYIVKVRRIIEKYFNKKLFWNIVEEIITSAIVICGLYLISKELISIYTIISICIFMIIDLVCMYKKINFRLRGILYVIVIIIIVAFVYFKDAIINYLLRIF